MNEGPRDNRHKPRGRLPQLSKAYRIRNRARPRSDFVLRIIHIDHLAAVAKAEARQRYGT